MLRKNKPHRTPYSGFTLIELLAVISIFAIVIALMLPTLQPAKIPPGVSPHSLADSITDHHDPADFFVAGATDERPPMVGLSGVNTLVLFDADTPTDVVTRPITGLRTGEQVLAFDTQVSSTYLYGVTTHNRIVKIKPSTGAATFSAYMGVGLNDAELKPVATMYNFYIDSQGLYENDIAPYEKWVRSDVKNTFGNNWFYILPNGDLYEWDGSPNVSGNRIARIGTNAYCNPELLGGASQTVATDPAGALAADHMLHFYRASKGNYSYNAMGGSEKWIKGETAKKSPAGQNNPWYFILPNGDIKEWDGSTNLTGATVGNYGVGIYHNPALLYEANNVNAATSGGQDMLHNFCFDRFGCVRNLYEDDLPGRDLKWFIGDHNKYYFLQTNGNLVLWDGGPGATGLTLANLGPNAWDNIEQVVNDYHAPVIGDEEKLDFTHKICRDSADGNYYYNAAGQQEKWLRCHRPAKSTGATNPWLVILPNGDVIEWDGGAAPLTGHVLGNFPAVYADPSVLCDAYADGTVLNNESPDSYGTWPWTKVGDHLNDAIYDDTYGIGADMEPDSDYLAILTGTQDSIAVDVKTGFTYSLPNVDMNYSVCGVAFNDVGVCHFADDHGAVDRFGTVDLSTGVTTFIGTLIVDSDKNMGLEIIGTGVPGGGDTLIVMTVAGASRLYQVNIATGFTTYIGDIGVGLNNVHDITINCETP